VKKKKVSYYGSGGPAVKKLKGVDVSGLQFNQRKAMERHAVHHTSAHLEEMVRSMEGGSSFSKSHKDAMEKVGD